MSGQAARWTKPGWLAVGLSQRRSTSGARPRPPGAVAAGGRGAPAAAAAVPRRLRAGGAGGRRGLPPPRGRRRGRGRGPGTTAARRPGRPGRRPAGKGAPRHPTGRPVFPCRAAWPRRGPPPAAPPRRPSTGGAWCRSGPGRRGGARWLPPRRAPRCAARGLHRAPGGGLPPPVEPARVVAGFAQPRPTHARKRAWTVDCAPQARGSAAHRRPVRASRIAQRTARGRPAGAAPAARAARREAAAAAARPTARRPRATAADRPCPRNVPPWRQQRCACPLPPTPALFLDKVLARFWPFAVRQVGRGMRGVSPTRMCHCGYRWDCCMSRVRADKQSSTDIGTPRQHPVCALVTKGQSRAQEPSVSLRLPGSSCCREAWAFDCLACELHVVAEYRTARFAQDTVKTKGATTISYCVSIECEPVACVSVRAR